MRRHVSSTLASPPSSVMKRYFIVQICSAIGAAKRVMSGDSLASEADEHNSPLALRFPPSLAPPDETATIYGETRGFARGPASHQTQCRYQVGRRADGVAAKPACQGPGRPPLPCHPDVAKARGGTARRRVDLLGHSGACAMPSAHTAA